MHIQLQFRYSPYCVFKILPPSPLNFEVRREQGEREGHPWINSDPLGVLAGSIFIQRGNGSAARRFLR